MRPRPETISTLGRRPARSSPGVPERNLRTSRSRPIVRPPEEPPPPERGWIRRWIHSALFDNVGLKFLSLVLALTVFLLVNTDRDREITVRVGVKYEFPPDKVLVSDELEEARVTIKGPWRRLRQFDERMIDRIRLDVSKTPTGEVAITPDMVSLPDGLTVMSISPRTVRVAFDKRVEKLVEISPVLTGQPPHGRYVAGVTVTPPTVKVNGGERLLAALTTIRTNEVSLDPRTESFETQTEPIAPEGVSLDPGQRVTVRVQIEDQLVTKTLARLPVTLRGDNLERVKWSVEPSQVEVTLIGKLLDVEKAQRALVPVVKLSATETRPRDADIVLEGVPPGVGFRLSPERVKVIPGRP